MNAPNSIVQAAPPSELKEALRPLMKPFRQVIFFSFFINFLMLAPTLYMLEVYDRVINSRSHMTLLMLTILVLLAYALMEMLDWIRLNLLHRATLQFDDRLNERVLSAMFNAHLGGIKGSVQAMGDLKVLRDYLSSPALLSLVDTPLAMTFLIIIFWVHPLMGVVSLGLALLHVLTAWLTEIGTRDTLTKANRGAGDAQQYADNCLRNSEAIEAMGMLGAVRERWMGKQRRFIGLQAKASELAGLSTASAKFFQLLQGSALLGLGAWLMMRGEFPSAGLMIVASILGSRAVAPLVQAIAQWKQLVTARNSYARLDELMRRAPARSQGMSLPAPKGALSVEAVTASAPGSTLPIIRNMSFAVPAGTAIAVIGPSASGKSTLARLMVGVWPALSGKLRLDGADIHAWHKQELGPHIGYLPQDVELFDGSLADNIARFGEVDLAQVEAAASLVGIHEFIESLPEGYATEIGDEGGFLSGGQRQRVGLARALYGAPRLVVLDEPNSNLDEAGELALLDTIRQLKAQAITVILITHRPNILQVVDGLLVMRDGALVKYGPRDEVLAALQAANQAQSQASTLPRQAQEGVPA